MSRLAALSMAADQLTDPGSRTGTPSSSRPSALQTVTSLTSRVRAVPSACLPARPSSSAGRRGTPVPSMPRYIVGALGGRASTMLRSSAAISRPRASAVRSTRLASTTTPASSARSVLLSAKLTMAAAWPTMRVTAGERLVPSRPRARSRGQVPAPQASQWYQARERVSSPRAVVNVFDRRPA